ncbi:WD repeat-containing protein 37-like [Biomphalaria glabrata]|uniref:WD repeat-containing protein 37 n=1 Tax=Biomphalaria glabrata TaxID=6526 RepID=A0A9W2YAP9_BIOGL|nr:WD repeat-containing protein 37-like [Biomphalaria glabrata]XP_055859768.1 WD repeat-containing protein 37-like [Biomphalaria glabrata]XP_055859769.1 WD repeat-containing protein 37-like [Biomphalaria glabrata]
MPLEPLPGGKDSSAHKTSLSSNKDSSGLKALPNVTKENTFKLSGSTGKDKTSSGASKDSNYTKVMSSGGKDLNTYKQAAVLQKTKGPRVMRRHRSHTDSSRGSLTPAGSKLREELDLEGVLPTQLRDRLHLLFSQIEKEFEYLYASNLILQERLDVAQEKLGCETGTVEKVPLEAQDSTDYGTKNKKPLLSQRIKTTYKQSTSKLVSSFRNPNPAYTVVRQFRGHRDGVWEVSVSRAHTQQVIATASADHTSRVYSVESGVCLLQYIGHKGSVNSIRFHPNQELILTASGDASAHIWRAPLSQLSHIDASKSHSSGEDDLDSSGREDGTDDLSDFSHDASIIRNPHCELLHHSEVVTAADWMNQGTQVITASWDRTAVLADAESREMISQLTGHDQELTDVHADQSQRLVLTSSKDTTFRLWDFRAPSMLVNVFQGHTQQVTSSVFASGDKVVSGSDDRTVKVWDMRNMRSPIAAIRTDSEVNRLSVSQSQNIIAIPHDNRNIRLYDINGVRIGRLPRTNTQGHARMVCSVAWAEGNPTCNLFSCGFDRQVLGWMINNFVKE